MTEPGPGMLGLQVEFKVGCFDFILSNGNEVLAFISLPPVGGSRSQGVDRDWGVEKPSEGSYLLQSMVGGEMEKEEG